MVPSSAMQMALANLLRGSQPKQQTPPLGDVEAAIGALPPIPGLPGAPGGAPMSGQLALANALAGKTGEASPIPVAPPPMGPASPPPGGVAPPAMPQLTVPENEPEPSEEADFSQALTDALGSQRAVSENLNRQRAVGNLGLLTGDRVLSNFGRAQLEQAETGDPNSLRYLSLIQAQQRLKQQADAEKRRAAAGDRKFEYDKEQDAQKRADALAKIKAGAAAAKAKAEKDASEEARKREAELNKATNGLRQEFNDLPAVKGYDTVASSYDSLRQAYTDTSGPGAINTVFSFMKIIDPGVAVMQGDVDLIRNSGGAAAKFAGLYDSALKGNPLTPKTREDLFRQATSLYESRRKQYDAAQRKFDQIARSQKVDPNLIFLDRDDVRIGGSGGGSAPTGGPARTTPGSLPTGADGNPTLDTGEQAPKPRPSPKPFNTEPFVYTKPAKPRPGGIFMFNPKGDAFFVKDDRVEAARAAGWKDVP